MRTELSMLLTDFRSRNSDRCSSWSSWLFTKLNVIEFVIVAEGIKCDNKALLTWRQIILCCHSNFVVIYITVHRFQGSYGQLDSAESHRPTTTRASLSLLIHAFLIASSTSGATSSIYWLGLQRATRRIVFCFHVWSLSRKGSQLHQAHCALHPAREAKWRQQTFIDTSAQQVRAKPAAGFRNSVPVSKAGNR